MAGCENCFFGGVKVGYKGDIKSPFVIVGESPGAMELAKGIPFVGPAGQLLEESFSAFREMLGFEPFVTNAINCLPRQKDASRLAQACQRCHPRLLEEIKAYPRKVILALGNGALHSLTGNYNLKITQVRGQTFKSPLAELGIVAAVHPSFLLRGGGNLQQFKRDLGLATSMMIGRDVTDKAGSGVNARHIQASGKFTPSPYKVLKTAEDVKALIRDLRDQPYAAGDCETDGFDPRLGSIPNPPEVLGKGILCMGICFEEKMTYVIPGTLITNALFENDVQWCWHAGKFDISWLREYGCKDARVNDDTMLMSYMLNERGGIHDLEQVGSDWLQAEDYKGMLDKHKPSKKHSYAWIPEDVLHKYQAIDTNLTYCLRFPLRAKIDADPHLHKVYTRLLIPGTEFYHQVEKTGFYVDQAKVEENTRRLSARADAYEKEFITLSKPIMKRELNIRSPIQLKGLLYDNLKLGPNSWSTDADQLEKLPKHPIVEAIKGYRKVHKQLSTFVTPVGLKAANSPDKRLHTTFKLHGTTTGRLSSNKPNIQNIPRDPDIRGQFIAAPGRVLTDIDLSQAELRVLAQLSGDKVMLHIFNSGLSLHDEVAEYLFGKGFNKEQKMIAKNINFGIIYGISAHGLREQVEIGAMMLGSEIHVTMQESQAWIDGWFDRFPQAAAFLDRCKMAPVKGQTLISAFGRKRRFGVVTHEKLRELQNEAMNFPEQSAAHDITMDSGIRLWKELDTEYQSRVVNEVHDCLISELPDDMNLVIRSGKKISSTMSRVPIEWGLTAVPFVAEMEVGYRWGSTKKIDPFKFTDEEIIALKGVTYEQYRASAN